MKLIQSLILAAFTLCLMECSKSGKTHHSVKELGMNANIGTERLTIKNANHGEIGPIKIFSMNTNDGAKFDSILIEDVAELYDSTELCKDVWHIRFRVNGGTGVAVRRSIIAVIENGRIYKSLDFISEVISQESDDYSENGLKIKPNKEKEETKTGLKCIRDSSYLLLFVKNSHRFYINDTIKDAKTDYGELFFDSKKHVFYSKNEKLDGDYSLIKGNESYLVTFHSISVPVAALSDNNKYWYFNDKWYMESNKPHKFLEMF